MSSGSYTRDWLENTPADHSTFGSQPGGVRQKAVDVAERLKAFFYGFTSGETMKGLKYLECCVQSTAPSSAADAIMLYCKDVSTNGELHAKDEKGQEIQMTNDGGINAAALKGSAPAAALSLAVPHGMIMLWATSTAPDGYLICDGSAVSRSTYSDLYSAIGTAYGTGDGSTTFNLPNLKGKVPVGKDAAQTEFDVLGETGGEKTHLLTSAESGLPAHSHTAPGYAGVGAVSTHFSNNTTEVSPSSTISATNNNTAADAASAHNNLQPYIVLNYIIKT